MLLDLRSDGCAPLGQACGRRSTSASFSTENPGVTYEKRAYYYSYYYCYYYYYYYYYYD